MTHRGRSERRGRDEGEEAGCLRERFGRRPKRLLELAPYRGDVDRGRLRPVVDGIDELLRVDPVAVLCRDAPRRGMRMRQQAETLELRQLATDSRRRDVHACSLDERFRPDGLAGGNVLFDHPPQDLAPAGGERLHEDMILPGGLVGHRRTIASASSQPRCVLNDLERPVGLQPAGNPLPQPRGRDRHDRARPMTGQTRRRRQSQAPKTGRRFVAGRCRRIR